MAKQNVQTKSTSHLSVTNYGNFRHFLTSLRGFDVVRLPSRMCCLTSSCLSGLCCIFALSRSPILALSNFWRCSWNAGGVFSAATRTICKKRSITWSDHAIRGYIYLALLLTNPTYLCTHPFATLKSWFCIK